MSLENSICDSSLINRFFGGDCSAFEDLVSRYEGEVFSLALLITGDVSSAEEVIQEVFCQFYLEPMSFLSQDSIHSKLCSLALTLASNGSQIGVDFGRTLCSQVVQESVEDFGINPESSRAREISNLSTAMTRLPSSYRAVFVGCDVTGLSVADVALALNISDSDVRAQLVRARLHLVRAARRSGETILIDGASKAPKESTEMPTLLV